MRVRVRPYLMAGIAVVAAGSIALPQSVPPPGNPTVRQDTVALTAQTKAFDLLPAALVATRPPTPGTGPAELPKLLVEALEAAPAVTPSASAPEASALALPGLSNAIIAAYDVVGPWMDWGVNTVVYATEWIPVVNWFTPQIDIFYFHLIRPIVGSAVFNIAGWVGGGISFGQGLATFLNGLGYIANDFVNAEIDWFLSFLPPLPPFFPLSAASEAVMAVQGARTAVQIPATAEAPAAETEESIGEPGQTDGELAPTPTEPVEADPEPAPVTEPAAEAPQVPAETDPEPEAPGDTVDPEETEPEAPKEIEESENSEGSEDSIEDSKDDEDAADEGAEDPEPTKPDSTDTDAADDTAPEKPSDTANKTDKTEKAAKTGSDS